MENFIVIAELQAPLIIQRESWLTLDSLLAAVLYRQTGDVEHAHSAIPLARTGAVWHGSAAFPIDPIPSGARFIADLNPARGDYALGTNLPRKILRVGGRTKPQVDEYPATECAQVVWFGCGDREAVHALLNEVEFVGKKGAHGYGQVRAMHIRPIATDRSLVLPDGTPARPIPASLWAAATGQRAAIEDVTCWQPAYWDMARATLCAVPEHRSLSATHLEFVDTGAHPITLPEGPAPDPMSADGMRFFHEHIGARLSETSGIPGTPQGAASRCDVCGSTEQVVRAGSGYTSLCRTCYSFAGRYEGIRRPGRMGAGWMGLVTPTHAHLVTSVEYGDDEKPFQGITGLTLDVGKEALSAFLYQTLLNPPEPPFLLFIADNSSVRVAHNLRISWSPRRAWICGAARECVDLVAVKDAVERWRQSGLSANEVLRAIRTRADARNAQTGSAKSRLVAAWEKLGAEPGLAELVEALPLPHTTEFTYFARFIRIEENNK